MKNPLATFTDLNGKLWTIETSEHLDKQIEIATYMIELNEDNHPVLDENCMLKIRAYWQDRLDQLKSIKDIQANFKTLFQHWNAGRIGNFGSFQTTIFRAYQVADSTNTAKLNAAFPEWFVNKYAL